MPNPTSFRLPFQLGDDVPDTAKLAIRALFNSVKDVNDAVAQLAGKSVVSTVQTSSPTSLVVNIYDAGRTALGPTPGIPVGGSGDIQVIQVSDADGNLVAYLGGSIAGTYGAWFKSLGIGGPDPNNPNLWVDNTGNIHMYGGTILGLNGLAVDADGNVRLKNILQVDGTTINPTLTTSFADLPELGSGNAAMTVTTKGNPCLIGISLAFISQTTGGNISTITVNNGGTYAAGVVPSVIISGDGSGASARANMTNGGGWYYVSSVTVLTGGSGYSYAAVSFSSGTATATPTVVEPVGNSGVPVSVQILQDSVPIIGPITASTDITGRVFFGSSNVVIPSEGSHSYRVQAFKTGVKTVQSITRSFVLVELG